ncbi:hypothetical protein B7P34_06070 [Streptosporangium nondiastaticum]|uniref:Uncharacterized protein n=1 Tax=Streptosporangium nondiastaticum TaxID=35764 RepID=A0A9X7JTJ2_9ACTN|nr:hypothetical protein [Streptosporangium nondiastaticum]PSJ29625.1 hypothetical protein B7P34_06070 [Streptosporangium nondiastaticum]
MENAISFEELDTVAGEVLPERTVMGVVATPLAAPYGDGDGGSGAGAGSSSSSSAAATGGGVFAPQPHDHGTVALSACQAVDRQGTPGLFGSLGLPSTNPTTTMTCIPAAVASH